MSRKPPKEIPDEFNEMDLEGLQKYIANNVEVLKDLKAKRNYVQQERELINSYYEISREELRKIEMEIEKEAFVMENLDKQHQEDINAFVNKFRHLEYDHDIFINDTLEKNSTNALKNEEDIRAQREAIYLNTKNFLKKEIKNNSDVNREDIRQAKENIEKKYNANKAELERRLNSIVDRYKNDLKLLEEDLQLRLKVEIHELEERKNQHINNLIKAFEDRMDAWKKENIEQIKENINLIKTNNENLKALKIENESLEKEVEDLKKNILELELQLESARVEHSQINNRLAKYYNQQINIENMNAKVVSLQKKCDETIKKTEEIEKKKEKLIIQISDLKKDFIAAVQQFKARAEYKNDVLEDHINQLNETYTKREIEIEELLKDVDQVAMDGMGSQLDAMDENRMDGNKSVFGREMFLDMLEHIRTVLTTKTQIIRNLKYSLALATKVKIFLILLGL
jgi:chromosome segregation ATPase